MLKSVPERFWEKVEKTETCWLWRGAANPNGYAGFHISGSNEGGNRRQTSVHRYSFTLANGPIPDGLEIDHLCHVPLCVNPAASNIGNVLGPRRQSQMRRHCLTCTCSDN